MVLKRLLMLAMQSIRFVASAKEQGAETRFADEQVKQQIIHECVVSILAICTPSYVAIRPQRGLIYFSFMFPLGSWSNCSWVR